MASEQYQPISVSTGSAQQAIAGTPVVTPALGDLMAGITSGMINLADLQKRGANLPLEAAQRNAELTDLRELRPLQREAQIAQLQNLRSRQQFEAEALPVLNDITRGKLKQELEDVKQHGIPSATLAVFNKIVPGFASYDPKKLHDEKTGQLNTAYALETMQSAIEKAEKIKARSALKPTSIKNVSAEGKETTFEQMIDPVSGAPLGARIPTGTKEVNVAEVQSKAAAAAAGLSNDVLKERNSSDMIKRYIPQSAAFEAVDEIRYRGTPPKNADDLAVLYEFIKILDPTSVVREGEKKFAESTAPGIQAFYNKNIQGLWSDSNKTMDLDTRTNLYATIDTLRSGAEKSVIPELKRISNLAIDRGIPLSQAFTEPELKLLVNGPKVPGASGGNLADLSIEQLKNVSIGGTAAGGENPVVTVEQARTLPPTTKFFRLVEGGPLKWNPNHPESPTQLRLRAVPAVQP